MSRKSHTIAPEKIAWHIRTLSKNVLRSKAPDCENRHHEILHGQIPGLAGLQILAGQPQNSFLQGSRPTDNGSAVVHEEARVSVTSRLAGIGQWYVALSWCQHPLYTAQLSTSSISAKAHCFNAD